MVYRPCGKLRIKADIGGSYDNILYQHSALLQYDVDSHVEPPLSATGQA